VANESDTLVIHRGGCHCGRVRFEADAPAALTVQDCNCSLCTMSGFWHLIVPAARFRLVSGADDLVEYRFNTGVAKHRFCRVCGIKSFYIPRSNPDGVDINARCLDAGSATGITIEPFDGRDWERNAATLAHLSRE
jgi:hypothetical protein